MKRPTGFTVLSLMMGLLSMAGFLNAWGMLSGSFEGTPKVLGVLALAYGVAAAVAAVQLWRFARSAALALRAWMAICGVCMLTFAFMFSGLILGGFLGLFSFGAFVGILFYLLDRYVQGKLAVAT